jgi:hypothetical protein
VLLTVVGAPISSKPVSGSRGFGAVLAAPVAQPLSLFPVQLSRINIYLQSTYPPLISGVFWSAIKLLAVNTYPYPEPETKA